MRRTVPVSRSLLTAAVLAATPNVLSSQTPAQVTTAAEVITAQGIMRHVSVIAHDSMLGRNTPSRGLESTARYVAAQFESLGLLPWGDQGTWFHRYPVPPRLKPAQSEVIFTAGEKKVAASLATAAYMAVQTAPQPARAEVVAISGRHTTQSLGSRVADKVVVYVLSANADIADHQEVLKHILSVSRGVVVLSALDSASFAKRMHIAQQDLAVRPGRAWGVQVRPEAVPHLAEILLANGLDLARARADTTPVVRELPSMQVSLNLQIEQVGENATAPNVVGYLPGSDPELKDQFIFFSAHMDHAGMVSGGADSIYNGADDNASGVAGLIELARAFSQPGMRPARSIAFLATSGSAVGFEGSRVFASTFDVKRLVISFLNSVLGDNNGVQISVSSNAVIAVNDSNNADTTRSRPVPSAGGPGVRLGDAANSRAVGDTSAQRAGTRPVAPQPNARPRPRAPFIKEVVANVTLDMIGRNAGDSVVVSGLNDAEFGVRPDWALAAHPELGLTMVPGGTAAVPGSDHFSFVRNGVPSLYFHNGTHGDPQVTDSPASIDADHTARIARLAFYIGRDIANATRRAEWTTEGRRRFLESQSSR